jgi:hypothetical protein
MRLGGERVGRWGIALLVVTGVAGLVLGWHGWTTRAATATPSLAGATATAPASPASSPTASSPAASPATAGPAGSATAAPATASPAPAGPARPGPKLSSEPYASFAFQVWPGTLSTAARQAMTGLKITVRKQGNGLLVTAGVIGQPASPPHLYAGGTRVYVLEASLGDDSGADYNLGDDGLVVTDAQQRVLP